ncbi:DMT family transporter [Pontivivens ytuae]|uniref:DMT family transporter n=1 Tax=Pontivivens ytuae TaxID=2789856 RepID=A0A7S9QC43_9RHOB|nr:DMT family transporter [Pontivivens ytuae]QPH53002.1 DMT family transporter [Pontivivens ytuae]
MTVALPGTRWRAVAALLAIGAAWGATIPMTKLAVSTGYQPFGLIFWQLAMATVLLGGWLARRGRLPSLLRAWPLFLMVALLGTLVPNSFSYRAAAELPAGVMAIVIAMVPMFALPVALSLGRERPRLMRFLGVALGAVAVVMIVGPEASLPEPEKAPWVLIALLAPLAYAFEGNLLSRFGTQGLDPVEVLFGASALGVVIALPLALGSGQWASPTGAWDVAKWAIVINGVLHVAAYAGYIALVGWAGAVFASQVAYVVTGAGVLWSMLLLGERYSPWVWAALLLMLAGLTLVRPRGTA